MCVCVCVCVCVWIVSEILVGPMNLCCWDTPWWWQFVAETCRSWHLIRNAFCNIFYCNAISEFCWLLKIRNLRKCTIILPVVLYGCETWSLTLREERKLSVFENKVLRRIFGPRRDEVTGEWRILHNEELNDLYCSPNIVRVIKWRRMRWAGHVARMGEERVVYRVLVEKPGGKRPLGRSRRRWVDNIRMDLHEVGCEYMDWIGLAQDRDRWRTLVSAVMNLRGCMESGEFLD